MRKVTAMLAAASVGVTVWGSLARADENVQSVSAAPISFRLASMEPMRGFEAMEMGDRTVYVAPQSAFVSTDVTGSEMAGDSLVVGLEPDAASRLSGVLQKRGADQVAVFVGGQLAGIGSVAMDQGTATISGLNADMAGRLSTVLSTGIAPIGATVMVTPSRTQIQPGEEVVVDVYVSGTTDLRSFQTELRVSGGTSGSLTATDLWVDTTRTDYVFAGQQQLEAIDKTGGRIGGVKLSGGVSVPQPAYIGTFTLKASPDANGTFTVNINDADRRTMLLNSNSQHLAFGAGPAATIVVGEASPRRAQPR